ncbi:MAG: type II toxin-antitoxin system PemK/MazF family toxin [Nanoarchaeota archaeon]
MPEVKRGEIWLVNLDPTVGHEIQKQRPAIIIQNDIGNKYSSITIVAPITSQGIDKIFPMEILLTSENSGLKKESKALFNQIRAVDKRRLIKKIGNIDKETIEKMNEAITISLGLW